jgi:hypothetical protein
MIHTQTFCDKCGEPMPLDTAGVCEQAGKKCRLRPRTEKGWTEDPLGTKTWVSVKIKKRKPRKKK